jgi:methionine sulfoxide reductase heme-binding subunit
MNALTQSTALWYASRATGIVAMVLLTAVVVLGVAVNRQGRLPGLPRFAVAGLHRSISLIAVVFVAIHVLTAVTDSYVTIRLIAVVIPFTSGYLPLELGLGAVALDLLAAVILTSLLRVRIGRPAWRLVHWLAYAAYPVAVLHGYTSARDLRSGALLVLLISCVLAVGGAVGWRLITAGRPRGSFPGQLRQVQRGQVQPGQAQPRQPLTSQGSPR